MLPCERQQNILDHLEQHHTATIQKLAAAIYASEATVRRDIAALEAMGLVKKVYGGVLLSQYKNEVVPAELRESANSAAKERIAVEAAKLVRDGDTLFFDSSSTVRRMCKHIRHHKNLKVITNNLRICNEFRGTDVAVYATGGEFFEKRDCFLGPYAERFVRAVNADKLFFSCKGLSDDRALTDVSEDEVSMRICMIAQARQQYCLCDSTKLGVKNAFTICHAQDITDVLCDIPLPNHDM